MSKRSIMMWGALGLVVLLSSSAAAQQPPAKQARDLHGYGVVTGSGYADFQAGVGGAPGTGSNLYWASVAGGPRYNTGRWYADVLITYPDGQVLDLEALYKTDCVFVDRDTKEAWIDGTIIQANNPAFVGFRANLYVKDGGPGGIDLHGLTPKQPGSPSCDQRPAPNFRERPESGNYFIN